MGLSDIVVADVRLGLDLRDALTGGPLIGSVVVSVPGIDTAQIYRTQASTYAVEAVPAGVATFRIESPNYVGQDVVATVPAVSSAAALVPVTLQPRTGYPFPTALTRVLGMVRYQPSPAVPPVLAAGAEIRVRGVYQPVSGPPSPVNGPPLDTFVTDDGQYTAWFLPLGAPSLPAGYRAMPDECRVRIRYTPPGGSLIQVNVPPTPIALYRTTSLPNVVLT